MKLVRRLAVTLVVLMLAWLALPWMESAWYMAQLSAMPAPATLPMPIASVAPRGLADTWGAARAPARRHEGIDIFAKKGTPILSTTEGVVLHSGQNQLGGNVVWIMGPAGHRHYYAHLDTFAGLSRGQRIAAGTVVGYVGNTGNARTTPPHLHYGIYTIGGAINPYLLLAGPAPRQSSR
ncbi:MAG: M23 family metallopeptidase [Gammaproteobacteria bacterium]